MPRKKDETQANKELMLEALRNNRGLVEPASRECGVARRTHYDWMKNGPEYAKEVRDIKELVLDFAEQALHDLMSNLNPAAIIFFLKTQGASRGYIERHEVDVKAADEIKIRFED